MNRVSFRLCSTAVALALVACNESTSPALITDEDIATDVATTSGSAIAIDVQNMVNNWSGGGFPAGAYPLASPPVVDVTRSRTCYDASDVVQSQCDATTTAKVVIHLTVDGTVNDTTDRGTVEASFHRVRDETITGLAGTETSRTHDAVGGSSDTSTFVGSRGTRHATETSLDSVVNVVFDLPRASNPWPVSGAIVRYVSGTVTLSGDRGTETRSYARRVVVTFPADSQGNVTIQINDRTCNLNLVTRRVTNSVSERVAA